MTSCLLGSTHTFGLVGGFLGFLFGGSFGFGLSGLLCRRNASGSIGWAVTFGADKKLRPLDHLPNLFDGDATRACALSLQLVRLSRFLLLLNICDTAAHGIHTSAR